MVVHVEHGTSIWQFSSPLKNASNNLPHVDDNP